MNALQLCSWIKEWTTRLERTVPRGWNGAKVLGERWNRGKCFDGWKYLFPSILFLWIWHCYLGFLWFASPSGPFDRNFHVWKQFSSRIVLCCFYWTSWIVYFTNYCWRYIDGRRCRSRGTISFGNLLEFDSSEIQQFNFVIIFKREEQVCIINYVVLYCVKIGK